MSAFEEIANDVPEFAIDASVLLCLSTLPAPWHLQHELPREFVKLPYHAYLEEEYRDTLLKLRSEEVHVVNTMQLTLDKFQLADNFHDHAFYLLVKHCAKAHMVPSSLFVPCVKIHIRDPIAGGGYAKIFRGYYEGSEVAMKKLRFFGSEEDKVLSHRTFCKEALVWRQLAYPYVLPFVGVDAETFAYTNFLCMVSPWMENGSLLVHMNSQEFMPERDTLRILWEVSSGLKHLHGEKVVRDDFHGSNIFISARGHAQPADFGLTMVGEITVGMMSEEINNQGAGIVRCRWPEHVEDIRRTMASDVYAFSDAQLEYPNEATIGFKLVNGERPARPDPEHCDPRLEDAYIKAVRRYRRNMTKLSNLFSHSLAPNPPSERPIPSSRLGLDMLPHQPESSIQPMSSFDEIANDAPLLDEEHGDSVGCLSSLVETLVFDAKSHRLDTFYKLLRQACRYEACRDALLELKLTEAQAVVDAIQLTMDNLQPNDNFYRHALYLLVKLSASSHKLPTSLFVHGVDIGPDRVPSHGGESADVFRGHHDGIEVSVKKLRIFTHERERVHRAFCQEALVWRHLAHPNVLSFIGVDSETFADTGFLCMVSPWMANGSLLEYVLSDKYRPAEDTHRILLEVSRGLSYLHDHKVVHGDIHESNILIDAGVHAQLADFGLAIVGETTMGRVPNNAGAGNIRYMAPERFDPGSSDMRRTMASDVYAFACVCLLLYTRKRPFHQELDVLVAMQVVLGNRPARPTEEHGHVAMTDVMWQLIMDAWHQDSAARPSMLQLEERLRSMHDAYNSSQRLSSMADRRRERVQLSTAQAGSVFNNDPPTVLRTSVILPISSSDAPGHPLTHWELVEPCVPQGETYKSPRKRNLLERVKWLLTRKNTRLE